MRPLKFFPRWFIFPAIFLLVLSGLWFGGAFFASTGQAVTQNGPLYIWGYNNYGQLGDGTTNTRVNPQVVLLPNGVTAVSGGGGLSFSLAIGNNGKIYSWGRNNFGQLGDGTYNNTSTPVTVTSFPAGVTPLSVSGGQGHVLVPGNDGKLYAWGYNISGQLGNGTYNDSVTPVVVNLPVGVSPSSVSVGYNQSAMIGNDNKLYMWGYNGYGQLGNGTYNDNPNPTVVTLTTGVTPTAVSGRGFHTMAIGSDNKLYTWGRNDYGQLGTGNNTQLTTPTVITLTTGVTPTAISANFYHSVAIGSDGKIYTWGRNDYGQLGNGTTTQSNSPVAITLPGGVTPVSISSNIYDSYAVGSDGNLYAWGDNANGQLGLGTTVASSKTPVKVNLPAGATIYSYASGGYQPLTVLSPPTVSINNVSNPEGNSGNTPFNFTASLAYSTSLTVTVNYATSNGTAIAPADYTSTSGTLTFAPGEAAKTITVNVKGNTAVEPNKTFTVTLSNAGGGATLGTTQGTGTIVNDDSTTDLTSAPNPSFVGQAAVFTATVQPVSASGTVTFTEGSTTLGTASLVSGSAVFTKSNFIAGSHVISATYAGNSTLSSSSSGTITQVVNLNPTTLGLNSSPNPSTEGYSVTFTATVSPVSASGLVTFTEGASVLGTAALTSGSAVFSTTSLISGSHIISATYGGDATYGASTSNTVTQVVNTCDPFLVTQISDNGSGLNCGTLSYALKESLTASTPLTITFALTEGDTITFTAGFAQGIQVAAGVTIYGGDFGTDSRIILEGNNQSGDGLQLLGQDKLVNLTIQGFAGKQLVLVSPGTGNKLQGLSIKANSST